MKYKILVVDDDKELVKMLCSYFNMKQYETITATDGMEALNKIKMKPDIILLDINMPRMDGIEVCRLIRSKVLCPILFLTARVDEDDKINGLPILLHTARQSLDGIPAGSWQIRQHSLGIHQTNYTMMTLRPE